MTVGGIRKLDARTKKRKS